MHNAVKNFELLFGSMVVKSFLALTVVFHFYCIGTLAVPIDFGPQVFVRPLDSNGVDYSSVIINKTNPLPSNCTAYINIASLMTVPWYEQIKALVIPNITYQNQFAYQGRYSVLAYWMWQERANAAGGITLGGIKYCYNLTIISSGYTVPEAVAVANDTVNGLYGQFDILMTPWSSGITQAVAPVFENAKYPFLISFAAALDVYKCRLVPNKQIQPTCTAPDTRAFKFGFGMLPDAKACYGPLFNVLKFVGAKSFASFAANETFTLDLKEGSANLAKSYGLKIYDLGVIPSSPNTNATELGPIISQLKVLDADVVLVATRFIQGCIEFIKELKRQNYFPRALLLSQCLDDPVAQQALGKDLAFTLDYITWHETLKGAGYVDGESKFFQPTPTKSSSQSFYDAFLARWGIPPDHLSAPIGFATGYALAGALEIAQSKDKDPILNALPYLRDISFFGKVGFDVKYGLNYVKNFLAVQLTPEQKQLVIAPLDAANHFLIYPAPTWDERVFNPKYLGTAIEIVFVAIAVCGVVFSGVTGAWIFFNKERSSVKAAQPPFLGLMVVGSGFLYLAIIFWTLVMTPVLCVLRNWVLSLGFTILYGTLVARVHRVKSVFVIERFDKMKVINDYGMLKIIGVLILIDFLILVIWTAVSPQDIIIISPDQYRSSQNYINCSWDTLDIVFLFISTGYKLLFVFYGLYLTVVLWQHRNSVYIESKQIIFCFYNLAIFAVLLVILQSTMDYPATRHVLFGLRSVCIFVSAFGTILTLMWSRFKNPDKVESATKTASGTGSGGSVASTVVSSTIQQAESRAIQKEIDSLKAENSKLQNELLKFENLNDI